MFKLILAAAISVTLAFSATAEAAQRSRQKAEEPPPPPPFQVTFASKSIEMATAGLSMPARSVLGTYEYDTLCFRNPLTIYLENAFSSNAIADLSRVFAQVAARVGYRTPGGSGDLFKTKETEKAEIQVGAVVADLTQTGCMSPLGASGGNAIATITIDWQVYDPLEQKIILRSRTQATGKLPFDSQSRALATQVTLEAFANAVYAFVSSPEFVAVATDPRGRPPAPASTDLFPQATNAQPTVTVQIANLPLRTKSFREQVSDLQKHVVTIRTAGGTGTGFYIADGLLLTNHHVVSGVQQGRVRFLDGREVPAEVIASDMRRDVAVMKTENLGLTGLALRRESPELSSQVYVIGSPLGQANEGTISSGIVSAMRTMEDGPMIQSDAAITNGNSGGPMFDDKGNVIGIAVAGLLNREGQAVNLNLFIPIADALSKLHIEPTLAPNSAPMLVAAPSPQQTAALAVPSPAVGQAGTAERRINVQMFPAVGPVKDGGHTSAIAGVVSGVGTSGSFTFARPDGVACSGRWTTLQSKPQEGSLVDKHRDIIGVSASTNGMVGGLAIGSCSNSATFQAEYYVVPGVDSGFGAATDSDGNIYRVIF